MGNTEKQIVGRQVGRSVKGEYWYNEMMKQKAADELGMPSERAVNFVFAIVCFTVAFLIVFAAFVWSIYMK